MSLFVKESELKLVNGGYLVTGKEETPVKHKDFIESQQYAEYLVKLAEAIKGKDFRGKKADSLDDIASEVASNLVDTKAIEFVPTPSAPKTKTGDALKKEALAFLAHNKKAAEIDTVNERLQDIAVIKEFEDFGLYFQKGVSKLNKIYTVAEVTAACVAIVAAENEEASAVNA